MCLVKVSSFIFPFTFSSCYCYAILDIFKENMELHKHCLYPLFYHFFFQVEGTPERPRLSVFRSNKHLCVQVIDDSNMHTLASVSTMQKTIAEEFNYTSGPTIVSS